MADNKSSIYGDEQEGQSLAKPVADAALSPGQHDLDKNGEKDPRATTDLEKD